MRPANATLVTALHKVRACRRTTTRWRRAFFRKAANQGDFIAYIKPRRLLRQQLRCPEGPHRGDPLAPARRQAELRACTRAAAAGGGGPALLALRQRAARGRAAAARVCLLVGGVL